MKPKVVLYWSRRDFRLSDNPALFRAYTCAQEHRALFLPVFVLEDYMCANDPRFQFGYRSRVFLSEALPYYANQFPHFLVLQGKGAETIQRVLSNVHDVLSLDNTDGISLFVNDDFYPDFDMQVRKVREWIENEQKSITLEVCKDTLTISKDIRTTTGNVYSVFTPFKNAVLRDFLDAPVTLKITPSKSLRQENENIAHIANALGAIKCTPETLGHALGSGRMCQVGEHVFDTGTLFGEDSEIPHARSCAGWYTSEGEALARFHVFLENGVHAYHKKRDVLAEEGTSNMSLALAWGLVSSRTLKSLIQEVCGKTLSRYTEGALMYVSELIWREFYRYLFLQHPTLIHTEFQSKYRTSTLWVTDSEAWTRFTSWMRGETGYPIVDAAMIQLQQTGWMHNRARMIVASILTKNLGVDWRWGQEYFRAMLIDLDEASNNGGWQWSASVGADPKPIRIFNPYLQAERFDPGSIYQKKWLSAKYMENPPALLVPHKEARESALKRYGLSR
jgi:deoxyribodipyrimidine photolyase